MNTNIAYSQKSRLVSNLLYTQAQKLLTDFNYDLENNLDNQYEEISNKIVETEKKIIKELEEFE